jgi:hypothetical protein
VGGDRVKVCQTFFRDVFEISRTYLSNSRIERAPPIRGSPDADEIIVWFENEVHYHDMMPDTVGAGRTRDADDDKPLKTGVILSFVSKKHVWQAFLNSRSERVFEPGTESAVPQPPLRPISCSYFMRVWREHFPHVLLRKKLRFAKCDTCVELRTKIGDPSIRDEKQRAEYRRQFDEHLRHIKRERRCYHRKREEAVKGEALSIILDGADQGAYGTARCAVRSRDRQHVYAVA